MLIHFKKYTFFILLISLSNASLFAQLNDKEKENGKEEESFEESFTEEPSYVDPNDETFCLDEENEENESIPESSSSSSSSSFSTPTKQISRIPKKDTPNGKGCTWGNLDLTPGARNGGNIIYIITHQRRAYRTRDLFSEFLTEDTLVSVVIEIAEHLILETNLFENGKRSDQAVYVGQTRDANVRGGQHSADLVSGAPVRKAQVLRQDRKVFQQNLLRRIHPDQLDLLEDIFMIITNANGRNGANSKGPKPESKEFYSKHLSTKIEEIKKRALSLALATKTESCIESTFKRKRDDDSDDRTFKKPTLENLEIRTNLFSRFASIIPSVL